jgi:hypothetical protein
VCLRSVSSPAAPERKSSSVHSILCSAQRSIAQEASRRRGQCAASIHPSQHQRAPPTPKRWLSNGASPNRRPRLPGLCSSLSQMESTTPYDPGSRPSAFVPGRRDIIALTVGTTRAAEGCGSPALAPSQAEERSRPVSEALSCVIGGFESPSTRTACT